MTAVQVCQKPFEQALADFVAKINEAFKAEGSKPDSNLAWTETEDGSDVPEGKLGYYRPVKLMRGPKYIRVVTHSGGGGEAYCFVEKGTGRILKAASWKAPTKGGRGNIFDIDKIPTSVLASTGWTYR